jgi:O-antigen/teichoic acid export membrane protein
MKAWLSRKLGSGGIGSSGPLFVANMLEAALPFLRNIALAHLISPTDFGLAISLSVVIGIVEVLTDFGLPVFAVRKTSDTPPAVMMGTLQSLALIRAALIGLVLVAASPWIAGLFEAHGDFTVYALLGIVVVVRGFENLGVKEMMRHYVFWREATVLASAQGMGALVTVVSAWMGYGFACMLHGMLATALVTVALSHLLSPTPFRLAWNTDAAQEVARFGRPLLINGLAVSCTLGDRLLVGSVLGPAQLALYNVAYGTATLPRTVAAKFLTSIFLPLFVANHERKRGPELFDTWAWILSCIAFAYGLALSLVGDQVLAFVFGPAFQPSRLFMCLAGISICVKFLMLLPAPQAYASGNTRLVAFGSILSALAVIPGAVLLLWQRDVNAFLLGLAVSEFVGLLVYSRRAIREQAFTRTTTWLVIAVPLALLASLALLTGLKPQMSFQAWCVACAVALGLSATAYGLIVLRCRIGLRMLFTT